MHPQTLRTFLNAATASLEPLNRHVVVLADPSSNLTDVVTCDSDETALASVKPLATADRDSGKPMDDLLTSIVAARNKDINKQIAIQLDEPALSDSGTCFVSVPILDATEYSPQTDPTIGFRCRFAHVGAAIAELDDLEALNTPFQRGNQLRNESVRCGGVWDPSVLARLSSQPSLLDQHMATFKPFKGIPPPSRFHSRDMFPVFITAPDGISLDTLNGFISEAYEPYREMDELPVTLSIVNRYEPSPRPAPARPKQRRPHHGTPLDPAVDPRDLCVRLPAGLQRPRPQPLPRAAGPGLGRLRAAGRADRGHSHRGGGRPRWGHSAHSYFHVSMPWLYRWSW